MRDMHCHILPGVDDGARDLDESLAMLEAAKQAGVTSIVCTPHCRHPYFDYDAMWDAFELLQAHAGGFPLTMGFEVNHSKLMELGMEWAPYLAFDGTNEFLLEFSSRAGKAQFDILRGEPAAVERRAVGSVQREQAVRPRPARLRLRGAVHIGSRAHIRVDDGCDGEIVREQLRQMRIAPRQALLRARTQRTGEKFRHARPAVRQRQHRRRGGVGAEQQGRIGGAIGHGGGSFRGGIRSAARAAVLPVPARSGCASARF
mgnify:CR=1 FL=1